MKHRFLTLISSLLSAYGMQRLIFWNVLPKETT